MDTRSKRKVIMFGLMAAVLFTSVAYAVLQTTLSITGTVTKKGGSWNIYFANVSTPTLTGKAEMAKPSLNGSNTDLTFSTTLYQPADQAVFTVDVVNDGSLDAVLSSEPILDGLNAAEAEDIIYTVVYADTGKALAQNDSLKAKETKTLKVTIQYDSEATTLSSTDKALNFGLTLIYSQSDKESSGGGGITLLEVPEMSVDGEYFVWNVDPGATSYKFYAATTMDVFMGGNEPKFIKEFNVSDLETDGSNYKLHYNFTELTSEVLDGYLDGGYPASDCNIVWYVVPCTDGVESPSVSASNDSEDWLHVPESYFN